MFLFLIWNLVKHETAAFFSVLFRQWPFVILLPPQTPWFQISSWLIKIWKCLRFSWTSGTGTSCDLRFNKCVWSIHWGMSSKLDICFLDCVLIALSSCSGGGEEENSSTARWGGEEPGVGEPNAFEGKSNKWIRSPSIYFDIPHDGLMLSPKLLSMISRAAARRLIFSTCFIVLLPKHSGMLPVWVNFPTPMSSQGFPKNGYSTFGLTFSWVNAHDIEKNLLISLVLYFRRDRMGACFFVWGL